MREITRRSSTLCDVPADIASVYTTDVSLTAWDADQELSVIVGLLWFDDFKSDIPGSEKSRLDILMEVRATASDQKASRINVSSVAVQEKLLQLKRYARSQTRATESRLICVYMGTIYVRRSFSNRLILRDSQAFKFNRKFLL